MDDIIDQSQQRNKRKSWYTIENVGLSAVYDLCIIKEVACLLLKQHLINSNMYKHFQKQIHNGTLKVHLAEVIDRIHKPSTFTIELYDIVALYKSTNVLWAIIALAVHLAGITDVNSMKQMEKVCVKIGRLYQREVLSQFITIFHMYCTKLILERLSRLLPNYPDWEGY